MPAHLHIDADIIAYRVSCAVGDDAEQVVAEWTVDSYVAKLLARFEELSPYTLYLSGKTNFRDDVAVTLPYKGNRWTPEQREAARQAGKWLGWLLDTDHKPAQSRPVHLEAVRQRLITVWGAVIHEGIEADDAIAIAVTADNTGLIVSIDKDFAQVAGVRRYDFVKDEYHEALSELDAAKELYKQILTGDAVDNIPGVEDCGPVGASELIDGCVKELDMQLICLDQLGIERLMETGDLVYLRREPGDIFVLNLYSSIVPYEIIKEILL